VLKAPIRFTSNSSQRRTAVSESRDLDENTLLDWDAEGNVCGITVEHARDRADIPQFSFEQITA